MKNIILLLSFLLPFSVSAPLNAASEFIFYPVWQPWTHSIGSANTLSTTLTLDAAGEKAAFVGTLHINGQPTSAKNCTAAGGCSIGWRAGAVSGFAGADDTMSIGIQDLSTSAGTPPVPDETFNLNGDLVGNSNPPSANAWNTTDIGTDGADTSYNQGDNIAIVFDLTACNGCSVIVSTLVLGGTFQFANTPLKTGGTWAIQTLAPNAIITFDDGSLGWITGSQVYSANSAVAYNSGSVADEYAAIFTVPRSQVTAIGLWVSWQPGNTSADAELILYDNPLGTPRALATITLDATQSTSTAITRLYYGTFPTALALNPGGTYAVALRPTTATNVTLSKWTVSDATHRAAWSGGTSNQTGSRADQTGAFGSLSTTQISQAGIIYTTDKIGSCCDSSRY